MKRRHEGDDQNGGAETRPNRRGGRGRSTGFSGGRSEGRVNYDGGRPDERGGGGRSKSTGSLAHTAPPRDRGGRPLTDDPFLFVEVPVSATVAGGFIGVKGATVASVRRDSGCRIHVRNDGDSQKETQVIEFKGTKMQVDIALGILRQIVHSLDPRYELIIPDAARVTLDVTPDLVGYIIGKSGSGVRAIRQRTACWVHVEELQEGASAHVVSISGPIGSVQDAYFMLKDQLDRVRPKAKDSDAPSDRPAADTTAAHSSPRGRTRSPDRRRATHDRPPSDRPSSRHPHDPAKRPRRDAPPPRVSRKMGPMYSHDADGYPPRRRGDRYPDDPYGPPYEGDDYYDPYREGPYDPARPAAGYGPRYDAVPAGAYPDIPDEGRMAAPLPAPIAQPVPVVSYDSAYGVPMAAAPVAQVQPVQVAAPLQQMAPMAVPGQVLMAQPGSGGQVMTIAGGAQQQAPPQVLVLQPDGSYKAVQVMYQLPDGTTTTQLQQPMQPMQQQQQPMQQQQQPQQQYQPQPQQQPQQQPMLSMAAQGTQMYSYSQPTMAATTSAPMSASQILLDASQAGVLQQTLLATSQALQQQQAQQQVPGQTMMLQQQPQMQQQQAGVMPQMQLMMPGTDAK